MGRKRDWIWKYISEYGKGAKCKKCDKTYQQIKNVCRVKVHLFHAHKIYDEKDNLRWKKNTRDVIWQYFSKQDGYAAQCNDCQILIQCAFDRCNLTLHLESKHKDIVKTKQEEIARTWLSPHFRLTHSYATCKHCDDRINIFRGKDLLRSHLDVKHNINEYSRCKERTAVNTSDGITRQSVDEENSGSHGNILRRSFGNQEGQQNVMLQQSVDPENYAIPSFDYNNASRQYLGNPEGQQSLMLQQSVDPENYAGPSFDYNNASRQYLGNQGGQQGLMLQQSVDTDYTVPSFDYNNASRQYLGNQEGQQSLMLQQSVDPENYVGPSFYHNNTPRQFLGNQESQQGSVDNYIQQGQSEFEHMWRGFLDYMIDP